ncbi:MAG TPA: NmrA family NAD(P)-binding protein [Cyclobacteriaceae bacterium]|nr:NmrA family NAD(P)-binding protein [Cyclobacteriaceae bacterium]
MKKIAFIGATGLLGKPVALALAKAGYEVTAFVRDPGPARLSFPREIRIFPGDLRNDGDVRKFLTGHDKVYLNLSVKQDEKKTDWHTESNGLKSLLPIAREVGIKRIFYLSSLIQRYEASKWWVFEIKRDAINLVRSSGIPSTIFYPSTFMEAITTQYMQGKRLLIAGKSKHKQHFIAVADYAAQVVKAVETNTGGDKDYVIQGPEGYLTNEALEIFKQNYSKSKLSISSAPVSVIRFAGMFNRKMNYGGNIIEALNNYPEKFEAEQTWTDLGKPQVTLKDFASNV